MHVHNASTLHAVNVSHISCHFQLLPVKAARLDHTAGKLALAGTAVGRLYICHCTCEWNVPSGHDNLVFWPE